MSPVDLEGRRVMGFDIFVGVIGGFEEVRVLVEGGPTLVAGLEGHFEDLVDGLVLVRGANLGLELGLVLRLQLDAVLFRERLGELRA